MSERAVMAIVAAERRQRPWMPVHEIRRTRVRHALLTGTLIGAGCGLVGALLQPNILFVLAPLCGITLGAWYAKPPTAIDAAIERAEQIGQAGQAAERLAG